MTSQIQEIYRISKNQFVWSASSNSLLFCYATSELFAPLCSIESCHRKTGDDSNFLKSICSSFHVKSCLFQIIANLTVGHNGDKVIRASKTSAWTTEWMTHRFKSFFHGLSLFSEIAIFIFLINNLIVLHEQKQIMLGGRKNKEK